MRLLALALIPGLTVTAAAETRRVPFWPDAVPATIQKHIDGASILGAVRSLGRYHRVQGSPGFRAAAEWLAGELTGAGLAEVQVEHLPADGTTSYAHFKSYLGWNPVAGRDALVTDLRPLELGSDHQVFESFGVPMVYFHDWPDVTIHTNKDVPENLDATKLGRVAYMTAGIAWTLAALPDAEAARLPALERAATEERVAEARHAALVGARDADDAGLAVREAVAVGEEELASIAALWPGTAADVRKQRASLAASSPRAARIGVDPRDARVPERAPSVRGPLDIYYYDHLKAVLGEGITPTALERRDDVLAYEALNLVDGKRSVAEIRDVLCGRYAPVPLAEVTEYLDRLAKANVIRFRAP
jgi:hypothetical protein